MKIKDIQNIIQNQNRTQTQNQPKILNQIKAVHRIKAFNRIKALYRTNHFNLIDARTMTGVLLLTLSFLGACSDDEGLCPESRSAQGSLEPNPQPYTSGSQYQPGPATTWQWQLSGSINTNYDVDVYDIDLYDVTAEEIAALQADGRRVMCYFSGGSSENWRSDFDDFQDSDMGQALDGWDGERWLDIRSENVRNIMLARLDLAQAKGCDMVEPDNMDGYTNEDCFGFTAEDQLAYNKFIGNAARERGLSVALKNSGDQAQELEPYFDLSVNEECHQYEECDQLAVFTANNKPIFNAEYADQFLTPAGRETLCEQALDANIRTLVLPLELDDSFRYSCD